MTTAETPVRTFTAIDRIAEDWVRTMIDLDPDTAIRTGLEGRVGEIADLSPEGHDRFVAEARRVVAALEAETAVDESDEITRTEILADLGLEIEAVEARLHERDLGVISTPAQTLRSVFDIMATDTAEDWERVARRLSNVAGGIDGYVATLRQGIADGVVPARRQAVEVAAQARRNSDPLGFFADLARGARLGDGSPLPDALARDVDAGSTAAAAGFARLAEFLETELAPVAPEADGVGRDVYALRSRQFLGAAVDLDETYEWGQAELARMIEEQTRVAGQIAEGGAVADAIAELDRRGTYKLRGRDALTGWMQDLSDRAIDALGGTHFDIPEPLRRLECRIAPTPDGTIYYTNPSDDFSRPGRMWWSVPDGVTEFDSWRETTTVYHEGVPGHHLQIGQAVYNQGMLNTWRRQFGRTSAHIEGWALYAERLMEELGFLDDPADRLGMLDGQRMRAARVVLDIGVHLGKPRPDGEGTWDGDFAHEFMRRHINMNDGFIRFEVNRYLGWPGQAPSYKVGQRLWQRVRAETQAREGAAFSLRDFHKRALDLGNVRLDTLERALLGSAS
jgi:uncharacterized protein (DUF885 family)